MYQSEALLLFALYFSFTLSILLRFLSVISLAKIEIELENITLKKPERVCCRSVYAFELLKDCAMSFNSIKETRFLACLY